MGKFLEWNSDTQPENLAMVVEAM